MIVGLSWKKLRALTVGLATSIAFVGGAIVCSSVNAQVILRPIGGVMVNADGVVRAATQEDVAGVLKQLRAEVAPAPQGLVGNSPMRMVSLAKLSKEIERAVAANEKVSDEVLYLAGLQRIEYVFVYPEANDIVLAGPAEGWQVREDASVVGVNSGRPVLQLEDLLVALRTVKQARQEAISVSIDPTPAGEKRLKQLLAGLRGADPTQYEAKIKEAFGPQMVTLTTVAADSRMARTLVSADYRMKTLAMNLESSPIQGLTSYMEMIRHGGAPAGTQPRWWMACDYSSILKSEDGLAWKLTGQGVKAMTQEEFSNTDGSRTAANRKNKLAEKWAEKFTENFDELAKHISAFGDLRNVMDMNVVATIIDAHNLESVAGLDLSVLRDPAKVTTPAWDSPKMIAPHCSFINGRAGWTISASGGVDINPWRVVAQQTKADASVSLVRTKANPSSDRWWWN